MFRPHTTRRPLAVGSHAFRSSGGLPEMDQCGQFVSGEPPELRTSSERPPRLTASRRRARLRGRLESLRFALAFGLRLNETSAVSLFPGGVTHV